LTATVINPVNRTEPRPDNHSIDMFATQHPSHS
jgi:hypothetical protein